MEWNQVVTFLLRPGGFSSEAMASVPAPTPVTGLNDDGFIHVFFPYRRSIETRCIAIDEYARV